MTIPDLSGTPWRAIILSEREEVWCLVDAIDYGWLVERNWNVWHAGRTRWQMYAKRNTGKSRATVRMHREIMLRAEPRADAAQLVVDHINGCTLDNRRANLRWATHSENAANRYGFGQAPALQLIVMKLKANLRRAQPALLEEVPF
ncbi:hypothetical protein IP86_03040 [Rhodopseudomonas sp. AAP120]|uniref:HNH endonuclease n=1 Tax=Rhodopseudomonas sp. AAP120 TaxID=1523430 RepID=UPI0006B92E23|nr:HNH endonuclease [Rhodopseudomonas sp. AAP120]KPG01799.1 hypothetical protein IP86_03040 [Rhodopseudomonas sp. AAP120]